MTSISKWLCYTYLGATSSRTQSSLRVQLLTLHSAQSRYDYDEECHCLPSLLHWSKPRSCIPCNSASIQCTLLVTEAIELRLSTLLKGTSLCKSVVSVKIEPRTLGSTIRCLNQLSYRLCQSRNFKGKLLRTGPRLNLSSQYVRNI